MDFKKLLEAMDKFAGQEVGQKPGDQVRGTEKAKPNKGKHPFLKRLVGELKEPKSVHKYEQELSESWLEFKETAPVPPAGAAAPTTPPKPGQPVPVDPKTAAAIKQSLGKLKTSVPNLDITKASTTVAKADANAQLTPGDQAVISKMAPQLANVIKNPQMVGQLKMMIDKAGQQDLAQLKKQQGL